MKVFFCYGKQGICERSGLCNDCEFCDDQGGEYINDDDSTGNPYWERVCALANMQRAKGIQTYGQGLESNPADIMKRFAHLEEELIDALMYCEWIKDKLMEREGEKHD